MSAGTCAVEFLQDARSDEPSGDRLNEDLEARCDNWGEIMRWRQRASVAINGGSTKGPPQKHFFATIGSFEAGYRSPQSEHWNYGSAPTEAPDPDPIDADEIEQAVQAITVYHHAILRYTHVNRLDAPIVLRLAAKAGRQRRSMLTGYLPTLHMAYGLLREALSLPAVVRKARARERVQKALQDG